MPKSREEFIRRVLEDLGVTGAGQTASAEDTAFVRNRMGTVFAELASRDIYPVGNYDEIDDAVFEPLVTIMASRSAKVGGLPRDIALERQAEDDLKRINRPTAARKTLRIDPMLRALGR